MGKVPRRNPSPKGKECFAINCNNGQNRMTKSQGISFHRFPNKKAQKDLYKKWVKNCCRDVEPSESSKICSCHFEESCINKTLKRAELREGAVPTIFDPINLENHAYVPSNDVPKKKQRKKELHQQQHNVKLQEKQTRTNIKDLLCQLKEIDFIKPEQDIKLPSCQDTESNFRVNPIELCIGCKYNYFEIIALCYENDNESLLFFQKHDIIPSCNTKIMCYKCNEQLMFDESNNRFICNNSRMSSKKDKIMCDVSYPAYEGTWLEKDGGDVTPWQDLMFISLFLHESYSLSLENAKSLHLDFESFVHLQRKCSEICMSWLSRQPPMGGPGMKSIVEIGFNRLGKTVKKSKTKCHDSNSDINGVLVFACLERLTNRKFISVVENEDKETLMHLVEKYILPGTTIYSAKHEVYACLAENENYPYYTVNHKECFVNSQTGVHIQSLVQLWRILNQRMSPISSSNDHYSQSIARYLFQDAHKDHNTIIHHFLHEIALLYPSSLPVVKDQEMICTSTDDSNECTVKEEEMNLYPEDMVVEQYLEITAEDPETSSRRKGRRTRSGKKRKDKLLQDGSYTLFYSIDKRSKVTTAETRTNARSYTEESFDGKESCSGELTYIKQESDDNSDQEYEEMYERRPSSSDQDEDDSFTCNAREESSTGTLSDMEENDYIVDQYNNERGKRRPSSSDLQCTSSDEDDTVTFRTSEDPHS